MYVQVTFHIEFLLIPCIVTHVASPPMHRDVDCLQGLHHGQHAVHGAQQGRYVFVHIMRRVVHPQMCVDIADQS